MDDGDKKLIGGLAIALLSLVGYWYLWKTIFGESEFSMILMATFGMALLVFVTQRLK